MMKIVFLSSRNTCFLYVYRQFQVITQITSTIERIFAYGCLDMILPPNMREPFIDTDIETLAINGLVFGRDTDVKGPSCSIVRNLFIKRARLIKCVDVIENSDGSVKELRFSMLNFVSVYYY